MKKKTEITFEVEETIILRQGGNRLQTFCQQCQASVELLTLQNAAALASLGESEIFTLIEVGQLHYVKAEFVFVCRNSLTKERID